MSAKAAVELKPSTGSQERLLLDPRPRAEMNDMVMEAMLTTTPRYWIAVGVLAALVAVCLFGAWGYMVMTGMGVAGIRRPVFWGVFIANFVFWIGVSHSGTLVSAILRIFKAEFRRSFTRAAELLTTFSLAVAGMYPLIHLGRVWRFYWMLPYPNQRWLWPNFHSPLMWDMMAIFTYLIGSTLYLYVPMIPDLAMARDRSTGWRKKLYSALSLGWRGTEGQWKGLNTTLHIFAFAILTVAFSVHTIVSWDFAMSYRPGWRSSVFGPYFVSGAIFSGVSLVGTTLFLVRATMKHMKYFLREEHFDAMGKLILVFSMVWSYFFFNDFLTEWYGGEQLGKWIIQLNTRGPLAWMFYLMLFTNIVVPLSLLWNRKVRRTPWAVGVIGIVVNIGMYIERYLIVTNVLSRNHFPFDWGWYKPFPVEILISIGSASLFILLYLVVSRLIPLIPVWEVEEGHVVHRVRRLGKAELPAVSELE